MKMQKKVKIIFADRKKPSEYMLIDFVSQQHLISGLIKRGSLPASTSTYDPINLDIDYTVFEMIINDAITGEHIMTCEY